MGTGHHCRGRCGYQRSHSTELADALDEFGVTTDWAALVAALRRVLAGDRDREQLLVGLDDIHTAILTAVLDRLPISPREDR